MAHVNGSFITWHICEDNMYPLQSKQATFIFSIGIRYIVYIYIYIYIYNYIYAIIKFYAHMMS